MEYRYEHELKGKTINVIQYGLGPIGINAAKAALSKNSVKIVGAVDIDPEKIGKDLGEILGNPKASGVKVSKSINDINIGKENLVVLHTTSSFLDKTVDQFEEILKFGANVVSSTEELLLPDLRNPGLADKLNKIAIDNNVTLLGTGINPGFAMDSLAVFLTGVCNEVEHIYCEREVDASTRREPLQRKVGAGLTVEEFQALVDADKLGHIGLKESIAFTAKGISIELDEITESIEPMVAEEDIQTEYLTVKKGQATGIKNIGCGYFKGIEMIKLDLRMYVGAKNPHDSIIIKGDPPINMTVTNGFAGDIATVASLVNSIPRVLVAPGGVFTMMDLPSPRVFNKNI